MKNVVHIEGLKQVLHDKKSGAIYEVHVDEVVIPEGSFTAILGPSGCGKTTLLTVLGLLRAATVNSQLKRFEMTFPGDTEPTDLSVIWRKNLRSQANAIRRKHIGFALQSGELLPALTVAENIDIPMQINGFSRNQCRQRRNELIEAFGLFHSRNNKAQSLARSRVNRLSGGEAQRVALARAISHRPSLVFVDEPTASLNREMAHQALTKLRSLCQSDGERCTVLMITHDEELAREFCDHIIRMEPGKDISSNHPFGHVTEFSENSPA